MEQHKSFVVRTATADDKKYSGQITAEMASSAQARGTGIARRSPEYVERKMEEGKAVIALAPDGEWVGFCYIEAWGHEKFVANSGLIVSPAYRGIGVATEIKRRIFALSREKYPHAKIFGLTTGLAVMKINSELGYEPVTYSELTDDEEFWAGCKSCVNYDILMSKGRKNCLCTAMLYDPAVKGGKQQPAEQPQPESRPTAAQPQPVKAALTSTSVKKHRQFKGNFKLFDRWLRYKKYILFKQYRKREEDGGAGGNGGKKKFFFFNLF